MAISWFTPTPLMAKRLNTNEISIGLLKMGSAWPVRVQSMANTPTRNVDDSVKQAIEIIKAGGELVRYTVINETDAEALKLIKEQLVKKGYTTPIVADVHFNPNLADIAARYVDKVRINPGNYIDKRATFTKLNFTDEDYQEELNRLEKRFIKFLDICREHNTAVRIGTNHGSLSDRIMSRYGDTPAGMVEATMEFLRICKKTGFTNVAVSLKSSNTRVMVQAYRLLSKQMMTEDMAYCLHLGVTEAGNGEDGRIKSAVGIGALMHDGLGDTIRVSLTEHPANEIPVANVLVKHFKKFETISDTEPVAITFNPYEYCAREVNSILSLSEPVVIADLSAEPEITQSVLEELYFVFNGETKTIERNDLSPDIIYTGEQIFPFKLPENTTVVTECSVWDAQTGAFPLFSFHDYLTATNRSDQQNWVQVELSQLSAETIELIKNDPTIVLVAFSYHQNSTAEIRTLINQLIANDCKVPVIVQQSYILPDKTDFQLASAADSGILFIDGLANGLWLKNTFKKTNRELTDTAFTILQASRSRTTKTEYISCPGCGRTLYDLQQTLEKVKEATKHLKGLKIAVMGCIVNGPGEMADADYGYVGSGPGKISLYKGKELVKRNIDTKDAVDELLKLIASEISFGN